MPLEDEPDVPIDEQELESLALRATVAAGVGAPARDPRPRKDELAEAHTDVLRLVAEVRRQRRREARWKEGLRSALAAGDGEGLRRTVGDLLDDTL